MPYTIEEETDIEDSEYEEVEFFSDPDQYEYVGFSEDEYEYDPTDWDPY